MSKVALSGNASGTGTFTIASPNSNTDHTLSLPDQTATLITNSADVLNIGSGQFYKDASGNVGIGTTDTANAFVTIKKANASLRFDPGSGGAVIQAVETAVAFRNLTIQSAATIFETNSTERARIDGSGNLLVGTTSAAGSAFRLVRSSDPGGAVIQFIEHSGNSDSLRIDANTGGSAGTGVYVLPIRTAGTLRGGIQWNGSNLLYNTSSDYRLKENVEPLSGALERVAKLNPVTYTWKESGIASEGFIAHELQAVVPDCVSGEKDAVDAEGKPIYQGIDTSFLVATLTAAIQELKAIVDAQGAEIAALKGTA